VRALSLVLDVLHEPNACTQSQNWTPCHAQQVDIETTALSCHGNPWCARCNATQNPIAHILGLAHDDKPPLALTTELTFLDPVNCTKQGSAHESTPGRGMPVWST